MYFNEKFNEKKEDPVKDIITFSYPHYIKIPQLRGNNVRGEIIKFSSFRAKYKFHFTTWYLILERNRLYIFTQVDDDDKSIPGWNGTYSSSRTKMRSWRTVYDTFISPDGFMEKYDEALKENKVANLVIFIELRLPAKYYYRPFEIPSCALSKHICDEYPTDMDNDFRFDFMKDSDFVIKCPDGEMPAMRIVLNNASEYMYKHFEISDDLELAVYHSIDVIRPIISCFHTRCFKMPKSFDLDYAKRLLIAKDFFNPDIGYFDIETSVHQSLCQKFVEEKHTFNSILQWLKIAHLQSFLELENMIVTVIADKFYFEWRQTFPENASNEGNPIFRDIFGQNSPRASWIFSEIEYNMVFSLLINVILD